jgi:hypothetical protein
MFVGLIADGMEIQALRAISKPDRANLQSDDARGNGLNRRDTLVNSQRR